MLPSGNIITTRNDGDPKCGGGGGHVPDNSGRWTTLTFCKIASRTSCQPTPRMTGLANTKQETRLGPGEVVG